MLQTLKLKKYHEYLVSSNLGLKFVFACIFLEKEYWQRSVRKMLVTLTKDLPKLLFMAGSKFLRSITSTNTEVKLYNDKAVS